MSDQADITWLTQELRGWLGLSQEILAAKFGVTFPTNGWEKGRAKPSTLALQWIEALLRSMGTDGGDLLKQFFPEQE